MCIQRLLQLFRRRRIPAPAEPALQPEEVPFPAGYLVFLNPVNGDHARHHVALLLHSNRALGDRLDGVLAGWLAERNWRPHLVAAVSLLLAEPTPARRDLLWQAIDRYSWVSPQLVATASLIDPEFEEQARQRIEACLNTPLPPPPEGDNLTNVTTSPKRLAALLALCERDSTPPWLAFCLAHPGVANRVVRDVDRGGEIARRWRQVMQQLAAAVIAEPESPPGPAPS